MPDFAANLRRLLARQGLTIDELARRSGVDHRTIKGLLGGQNLRPHARTLFRLSAGLGLAVDELFHDACNGQREQFDRSTNSVVQQAAAAQPALFSGWTAADFDELHSRFGCGGALTLEGALEAVRGMNRQRAVHGKLAVLLESSDSELASAMIDLLYQRVLARC